MERVEEKTLAEGARPWHRERAAGCCGGIAGAARDRRCDHWSRAEQYECAGNVPPKGIRADMAGNDAIRSAEKDR